MDYKKFALPLPVCIGDDDGVLIQIHLTGTGEYPLGVVVTGGGFMTYDLSKMCLNLDALGEGEKDATYLVDALRAIYRLESRSGVDAIVSIRQIARTALGLAEENGDGQ